MIYRLPGRHPPIEHHNHCYTHAHTLHVGLNELTQRFENVCLGFIYVGLVSLRAVLGPFPLLLVAGLASVAPPPVVALGNVHANVHSVVTCHGTTQQRDRTSDYSRKSMCVCDNNLIHYRGTVTVSIYQWAGLHVEMIVMRRWNATKADKYLCRYSPSAKT